MCCFVLLAVFGYRLPSQAPFRLSVPQPRSCLITTVPPHLHRVRLSSVFASRVMLGSVCCLLAGSLAIGSRFLVPCLVLGFSVFFPFGYRFPIPQAPSSVSSFSLATIPPVGFDFPPSVLAVSCLGLCFCVAGWFLAVGSHRPSLRVLDLPPQPCTLVGFDAQFCLPRGVVCCLAVKLLVPLSSSNVPHSFSGSTPAILLAVSFWVVVCWRWRGLLHLQVLHSTFGFRIVSSKLRLEYLSAHSSKHTISFRSTLVASSSGGL